MLFLTLVCHSSWGSGFAQNSLDISGSTVIVSASALPSNGSQETGGNLASIKAKTDNLDALLSSRASSANQATEISSLSSIDSKLSSPVNGSGSGAAATVSTVSTITAPANSVGFILMNLDTSTTNMRWAVGRTAAVNLGQQLQPGRDTGFVPVSANVSIIAESGTVTYDIQWVIK